MLFRSITKKGFTLVEVLLVCSIFAIMVVGIILAVNRSYTFMNNTKLQIEATNFAREGVEMMFNIRDTNRRKCSGQKDAFWLYLGTGSSNEGMCNMINENSQRFNKGIYAINEGINSSGDRYIYATNLNIADIDKFYDNDGFWDSNYAGSKILFSGNYYYRSGSRQEGSIRDLLEGVDFYRIVRVYGIYKKNENGKSNVDISQHFDFLTNGTPAELRFCVKVFYTNHGDPHSSELCSIMTNFEE